MGEWLRANGETVYGTVSAGIDPQPWGAVTRKGDKIYVHVLTPQNSEIYLPLDCRDKNQPPHFAGGEKCRSPAPPER